MTWFIGGLIGCFIGIAIAATFTAWLVSTSKRNDDELRCYEVDGGEHNFEAVYDTKADFETKGVRYEYQTYVRHICIDCGEVVEREADTGIASAVRFVGNCSPTSSPGLTSAEATQ